MAIDGSISMDLRKLQTRPFIYFTMFEIVSNVFVDVTMLYIFHNALYVFFCDALGISQCFIYGTMLEIFKKNALATFYNALYLIHALYILLGFRFF